MSPPLPINKCDRRMLRMLKMAPFERRPGGWRFGTRKIADQVIGRLVAQGRAGSDGSRVWLVAPGVRR